MNLDETEQLAADMRAAHLIKTLMERNKELEASLQKLQSDYDSVGAGGVSAQRITQQAHSTEREAFEKWAASDFSGINLARDGDDYSFVPAKEWWLAWQARAALDADHIEHPPEMVAAPAELNLDDYYCKGCGRIGEIEELSAQDKAKLRKLDGKPKTAPVMEPVLSDVLPAIGSRVFIRHRRDNDAHACIVTGYYAWEDDGGNPMLHRVFVRLVYEGTNTSQSCILCECHPSAEAALAATPATAAQSEVPKVGSAWRHKNGNAYRVVAIANDCDAHFSERYPVTVVYQGENGKMWARRADDWHRSMTHDATAPSTAPSTAPVVLPEPDEYQYRMKPNWDDRLPWTPWETCSKESAANFRKRKEIHDWIYEVRERYTEQQVRELLAAKEKK